jgi:protein TonB
MKGSEKVLELSEIIFEKRNKEYGAYLLRRLYNKYVSISTTSGAILFTLIVCYPLITASLFPKEVMVNKNPESGVFDFEDLKIPPVSKPDINIPVIAAPKTGTIKYLVPIVKPDEFVNDDFIPTVEDLIDKNPGTETVEGNIGGTDIIDVADPKIPVNEVPVTEQIFTWAEEMPEFPGGNGELLGFFAKNINYPEIAIRAGVEGKVILSFVVDKKGEIKDVNVLKGIGAGCDEEAMRIIKSMPRWNPGKQNGNAILTRINVPVVFKLN